MDPPHIGHANVVTGVINSGLVDQVLVIPAYQNVWKGRSTRFPYRHAMCCMAFDSLPNVFVSDIEKSMYVPSYHEGIPTYNVLMELSSRITDKELVIITTPETYREIPNWYDDNEEHNIHPVQIPKNQMGIAVKELKAKYPAADGKKIADLVKANLCN